MMLNAVAFNEYTPSSRHGPDPSWPGARRCRVPSNRKELIALLRRRESLDEVCREKGLEPCS